MTVDEVLEFYGSMTRLAEAMEVSRATLYEWRRTGIPLRYQCLIEIQSKELYRVDRRKLKAYYTQDENDKSKQIKDGFDFEQTIAVAISTALGVSAVKNDGGEIDSPDVVGVPGWSVEVKHTSLDATTTAVRTRAWSQAVKQSEKLNTKPVVIYVNNKTGIRAMFSPFKAESYDDYSGVFDTDFGVWCTFVKTGHLNAN